MTRQNVSRGLPSAEQDAFGLLLWLLCWKSPHWWEKGKLFSKHNGGIYFLGLSTEQD